MTTGAIRIYACAMAVVLFLSLPAQAQTGLADSLLNRGQELLQQAEYDSANVLLEQSAKLYLSADHPVKAARCYNEISSNYRQLEMLDRALAYAHKVLTLAELHDEDFSEERVWAYYNIGMSNTVQTHYRKALEQLNRSLALADSADVSPGTRASVLGGIGFVYDDQGQYEKAIAHYARALRLLQTSGEENKEQLAKLYNNIGFAYSNMGDYDTALQFYKQETKLNRQLKGEYHPDVAGGYNNLGAIYYRKGDIGEAVSYFKKSLRIIEKTYGTQHPMAGMAHNNIGESYLEMQQYKDALRHLEKAVDIKISARGKDHPDVALSYAAIADIYAEIEEFDQSLEYYNKSLAIREESLGEKHPLVANTLIKMGEYFLKTGQYDRALSHLLRGIRITEKHRGKDHPYIADAYLAMGKTEAATGRYEQALTFIQEATIRLTEQFESPRISDNPSADDTRYPSRLAEVLFEKAKVLQESAKPSNLEQLNYALNTFKLTTDLLDKLQLEYRSEQSKLLVSRLSHEVHERALQTSYTLYENGSKPDQYKQVAFYFSEKSKARVIMEQIRESQAKRFAGIPDSLLQREEQLRKQIASVQQRLMTSPETVDRDGRQLQSLKDSLFALDKQLTRFLTLLERRYPAYYELKFNTNTVDPRQVQQFLDGTNKTAIEFFLGDSTFFAFRISADRFEFHKLPVDSAFRKDIETFRSSILRSDRDTFTKLAHTLYKRTFSPILGPSIPERLLVIPDGPLNLLPYEALLTDSAPADSYGDLPYLLLSTELSYSPSLTLSLSSGQTSTGTDSDNLIAFAPSFDDMSAEEGNRDIPAVRTDSLGPLPFSEYEVREIAAQLEDESGFLFSSGGSKADLFVGERASEASFKNAPLHTYRYIHLATHAFISEEDPGQTGIFFSSGSDTGENGILFMEEIYNLNLDADLVVLSACETGGGAYFKGEGIVGAARAFRYAGARNLLVSLWKIEDRSTAQMMVDFYRELLDGRNYTHALRSAKRKMLQHPRYSNPRYWAPFIMIGS